MANEFLAGYIGDGSVHPLKAWLVFEVLGVFVGRADLRPARAAACALAIESGPRASTAGVRLAVRVPRWSADGASAPRLARGCTSGQALTGGALLNVGSWAFMMMVFGGAYAGRRGSVR